MGEPAQRWTGWPKKPPVLADLTAKETEALMGMRKAWEEANPWTPDWAAVVEAGRGASLAMREAERTAGAHERELVKAREMRGDSVPIRVTERGL